MVASGETQERTLVEMLDLLKGQLGLSGSVADVLSAARRVRVGEGVCVETRVGDRERDEARPLRWQERTERAE